MFGIPVRLGKVFRVQMNIQILLSYNVSTLRDNDLVIKISWRLNLTSAEKLYTAEFERLTAGKEVLSRLCRNDTEEIDEPRKALVLYVGIQTIDRLQNKQISHALGQTPEIEIMQKLMSFNDSVSKKKYWNVK